MSVDKAFREMVRNEIEAQLKPLRELVSRLEAGTSDLDRLRNVAEQLAPLAGAVGPLFGVSGGGGRAAAPAPARRGPGRPARSAAPAPVSTGGKKRGRKPAAEGGARDCAIIGCGKPSRTKGYCAAHYQKLRMLEKTNRRPSAWVDYAEPNSVEDIKLPRGRAAAKALAEAQKNAG
ncbi:cell wall protein [Vitiosangium sp. GDMCC 1.1324]|uniref:cell wall protein n=1 Tax=Vitiosangium sp. (strain GDMCC 1.1324) TaxID=2138576 RepID=UPI000D3CA514|nr:cell wall protein [Vitiosangium sp. GDMCC 1.1324]PTL79632.1 cell wall protein [Vitiosangium sp. GDMCC 1.1324]